MELQQDWSLGGELLALQIRYAILSRMVVEEEDVAKRR